MLENPDNDFLQYIETVFYQQTLPELIEYLKIPVSS